MDRAIVCIDKLPHTLTITVINPQHACAGGLQ